MTSRCRRRAIYWLPDHPRKLVTLNPKLKSTGAGRYQLLSRWWDAYRKQLGLKDFSPKSQDAVALQQIKERGALPMIDRGGYPPKSNAVAAISGLHCRALVMVSSSIRLTAWLQNSKKRWAERSERLMYEQSHRDYLRSGYLHHRLACHGLLIITVITPLPTKPSATKMPENWSWRTRQLLTCRCVSGDVAALDAKYTKEQLMLKLKKWCSAWWCCRWSSSVAHQSSLSVSAWSYHRLRRG